MQEPKIAITIINFNGLKNTLECIQSLKKINYKNYLIFIVDNNSEAPEKQEIMDLEKDEKIKVLISDENLGFAGGSNVGILEALAVKEVEYVITLNNDTTVEPEFLLELVQAALSDPNVGMVAPTILQIKDKKIDRLGLFVSMSCLSFNRTQDSDGPIFCPSGCCGLYSRKLLESVFEISGYFFDPDFFCYCEDLDLGFRAQLLGFGAAMAPKSVVYHLGGGSISDPAFPMYLCHRNTIWNLIKNFPLPLLFRNFHWILLSQLGGLIKRIGSKEFWVVWEAKLDGIRGVGKMVQKRRDIQSQKKITNRKLLSLMK